MAIKESYAQEEPQQNPWVQTPLRESYALSEAAGWYGHTYPITIARNSLQLPTTHHHPQIREF